jgi:hypothetical protein
MEGGLLSIGVTLGSTTEAVGIFTSDNNIESIFYSISKDKLLC